MFLTLFSLIAQKWQKKIEEAQSKFASEQFACRDDALAKVIGPDSRGRCRGVGLGVTRTNLFGKNPYKEALAVSQVTVKESGQEITSLKVAMSELMKRVEAMEKENKANNESVCIKFFTLLWMHILWHQ